MSKEKTTAQLALAKLSPQHRKFVEAYCDTFNATKAALAAKYSEKTARQQGSRLLTIVDIKSAVKAVLDTSAMDPEEIAARWTRLARAGLQDFFTKVQYEKKTKRQQPLAESIAQAWEAFEFEKEYTYRSAEVLGLKGDALSEYCQDLEKQEQRVKLDVLRWEVLLEKDPYACREIDGPKVVAYRMDLDLVKAEELGMLDLVLKVTPTEFGLKMEMRSPDAALDNLAKHRGMLTNKVDVTSGGQRVTGIAIVDYAEDDSPA